MKGAEWLTFIEVMNLYSVRKAYSLVELVIAMGLFVILIGAATMMMFTALKNSRKTAAITRIRSDGAYVLDLIAKDVRYASAIDPNCTTTNSLWLTRMEDGVGVNVTYALNTGINQITKNGNALTSSQIKVVGCPTLFSCSGSEVTICFGISMEGIDVTDTAQMLFKTQVSRRNPG